MTAIITSKFRITQAQEFKETLELVDENHYLFVGKPRAWPNEVTPPLPLDTLREELRAWESMMGLKHILEANTSHVIPRHDWDATGNTIYIGYSDNDPELFFHPTPAEVAAANLAGTYTPGSFYAMTDEFHVFKCLSNGGGAKSTVKPLKPGNSLDIVETSDGYRWKYMLTVSTSDALKWLTDAWIPVKVLSADDGSFQWIVQQGAVDGIISDIRVTAPGSGYENVRPVAESLSSATPTTVVLNAAAQSYATGNGFYNGGTFWVETGIAAGASRVITAYDHGTNTITLDSALVTLPVGGDDYKILPTVTITGNGAGAKGKVFVDQSVPDGVLSVSVTNGGTGYRYASATISGAAGSGATVEVVMPPLGGHGLNAIFELGAHFIEMNVRLEYNEGLGDFPLSNDYRQIGIVRNVTDFGTSNLSTAITRIAAQRLQVVPLTGTFLPDEDIIGPVLAGSPVGFIVDWDSVNNIITFVQDTVSGFGDFTPAIGQVLTGGTSGATATLTAVIDPEVNRYSGDIIYLENRRAILRAPDQLEDIKLIIEF